MLLSSPSQGVPNLGVPKSRLASLATSLAFLVFGSSWSRGSTSQLVLVSSMILVVVLYDYSSMIIAASALKSKDHYFVIAQLEPHHMFYVHPLMTS